MVALFVLFKMTVVQAQAANIGNITELNGAGRVVRDDTFQAALDFNIESYDNVQTSMGDWALLF